MVTVKRFPERGDVILVDLKPVSGHEQGGRTRPVLVLSPYEYNIRSGLCIVALFTNQEKFYPFEAKSEGACKKTTGVVLADALRSIDWIGRRAVFIEKAGDTLVEEVLAKVATLLGNLDRG